MDETYILTIGREMFKTAIVIAAPVMVIGMAVGIFMALFQAITSVQEQTLTMIPKILAVAISLMFLMPWIFTVLVSFSTEVLSSLRDAAF